MRLIRVRRSKAKGEEEGISGSVGMDPRVEALSVDHDQAEMVMVSSGPSENERIVKDFYLAQVLLPGIQSLVTWYAYRNKSVTIFGPMSSSHSGTYCFVRHSV